MKNTLILGLTILLFASCGKENKPKIVHAENNGNEIPELKKDTTFIEISDLPIQIDSTDYLIHPIGDFRIEDNRGKIIYKSSRYGSNNFKISNYGGYRITGDLSNVKFQHIDSEKLSSLTENIIKIKSLSFLRKVFDNTKKQLLVYEVTDKDTNQDGKLDFSDVNTLYISSINGTDFRKLTDNNKELIDWKIIESKNRLYFRTIEDTNKDGEFDKKDIVHYKYVDLNSNNFKITEYNPI
ncbi:hypothetical protein [Winogradskyella forsetii]|uniref:hypothetical protein n=1 Tax=Winogradskyella forsetii TaxID=2686077 RepID=UPI0015BFFA50|nr:hypothetical protein [Winogradskyella forsetii]